MRSSTKLLVVVMAIVAAQVSTTAFAQQLRTDDSCNITSVFIETGWKIPGLGDAVVEEARRLYRTGEVNNPNVFVTVLRPRSRYVTKLRIYYFDKGRLEIRDQSVFVRQIYRFDVSGRVIAYGVLYPWASVSAGKVAELGRITEVLYSDDEGSGIFREMDQFAGFPFRVQPPAWALSNPR